jgi:hypothetical protein
MWSQKQHQAPQAAPVSTEEMYTVLSGLMFCRLQKQLGTLYSFFPNSVQAIEPNSVYQVHMAVGPSRIRLALELNLPRGFPEVAPILSVSPSVAHRWVSYDMRVVGHEALATWHRNLSVGKIIKDIEIEFNLRPPTIVVASHPPVRPVTTATTSTPSKSEDLLFAEVDSKNAKQLKELLEKEDKFEEFFNSTNSVREARSIQDGLVEGNLDLASAKGLCLTS